MIVVERSTADLTGIDLYEADDGGQEGCGWADWNLPASKADPQARGATRTLECVCGACDGASTLVGRALCPRCVCWILKSELRHTVC